MTNYQKQSYWTALLSLFTTAKTVAAVTFSTSVLKNSKFKRLCDLNHKKLYKNTCISVKKYYNYI